MHIHGHNPQYDVMNISSSAAAQNQVAQERAAEVRRKLLRSSAEVSGATTPEEDFLIGQWMDQRNSLGLDEDTFFGAGTGRDPDFG
jgi:hypothetical protein